MELKSAAYIALAALAIWLFFNYAVKDYPLTGMKNAQLSIKTFNVQPGLEVGVGEQLTITVEAEGGEIESINYYFLDREESYDCGKKSFCAARFTQKISLPGAYKAKVEAIGSGGKMASEESIIRAFQPEKTCNDSTRFGDCSSSKPNYCESGALIEKCSFCGCEAGFSCSGESCIAEARHLSIENVAAAQGKIVRADSPVSIKVGITNEDGTARKGAGYRIDLNIINSGGTIKYRSSKEIRLESDIQKSGRLEIAIDEDQQGNRISFGDEGALSAEAAIYGIGGGGYVLFDRKSFYNIFSVSNDQDAPSAPTALTAEKSGSAVLLKWNQNPEQDLSGYKIYESTGIESAYIAYKFRESAGPEKTSFQITGLGNKKYYFVITAVDQLGNESAYSQPASIDLS